MWRPLNWAKNLLTLCSTCKLHTQTGMCSLCSHRYEQGADAMKEELVRYLLGHCTQHFKEGTIVQRLQCSTCLAEVVKGVTK